MKFTKKILTILIAGAMMLSLAACENKNDTPPANPDPPAGNTTDETPEDPGTDGEDREPIEYAEGVDFDFAVIAFQARDFTIAPGMDIKIGGNMGPREGGEGGGATDAIRIVGFQGYANPLDGDKYPSGCVADWGTLISQNGPFWNNISHIEGTFYFAGREGSEAEEITNTETFFQGGALLGYDFVNSGENLLSQFDEELGGGGLHWGNLITAKWDVQAFRKRMVSNFSEEEFDSPALPVDPDDESSDREGGGVLKFGLQVKNDNVLDDVYGRIVWTDVKIYVFDKDLFMEYVEEVFERTGKEMSDNALENVIEV